MKLVPLKPQHILGYYKQYQDPEMIKLLDGEVLDSQCEVSQFINESIENPSEHDFAIIKNRRFLGIIGIDVLENGKYACIYYWLGQEFRGKGIATSAIKIMTSYAKNLKVEKLYAFVWPHNRPSISLLIGNGFVRLPETIKTQGNKLGFMLDLYGYEVLESSKLQRIVQKLGF
ncbi:GNAT family N-acetyltransferase [Pleionea sediminis]|uniref:GNAT family N-acetyltransferase n=1 Tax=Pleionea sediminis TaxID=2569479 RepID=UPI0011846DE6|nr:GNAT family N-acetyltransferase [Pleionea sediminis]